MEFAAKCKDEGLEEGMQTIFDATVCTVSAHRLHQMARRASEIPPESSRFFTPQIRHLLAALCVVALFVALPLYGSLDVVSGDLGGSGIAVSQPREVSEWEFADTSLVFEQEIQGVGLDLLHGSGNIDSEVLEEAFQALLNENI